MTWHADVTTLDLYGRGLLDDPHAYSVELHLMACTECRQCLGSFADRARLARVWAGIESAMTVPEPGAVERLLLSAKIPDHTARLLAATPSLRGSWLLAVAIALAFGVVAAHAAADGILLFLVVAPLLPLAGVAAAYGPGVDPTYEIGLVAPLRSFHLMLIRALAVLASTTALALVASLALPRVGWATAAWLLPSLGLVATSLALANVVAPLAAAVGVGLLWIGATTLGTVVAGGTSFFGPPLQTAVLMLTVMSTWWLGTHRDGFDRADRP